MRCTAWLTILIGSLVFVSLASAEEAGALPSSAAAEARRIWRLEEKRVLESLSRRITLECRDEPLGKAIDRLSQLIGRPILIDEQSLAEGTISKDTQVNLSLGEMTARQTLHFLLRPTGLIVLDERISYHHTKWLPLGIVLKNILKPLRLIYSIEEGALVIMPETLDHQTATIRIYDVSGIKRFTIADADANAAVKLLCGWTSGKWQDHDGEGGYGIQITSNHIWVWQPQEVLTEIALALEDLWSDEPVTNASALKSTQLP